MRLVMISITPSSSKAGNRSLQSGTAKEMQGDRETRRKPEGVFDTFDDFGSHEKMFVNRLGRSELFNDPFFTRPFGGSHSDVHSFLPGRSHSQERNRSKGPIIEELDEEEEEKNNDAHANTNHPIVEHPDDQDENNGDNQNKVETADARNSHRSSANVMFRRVTHGGIDGAYYTATTSLKTGNDGVSFEESKQADRTTGEATHKISRGIHDKGHSVTRKLDSSGKVDTVQTLHNLNEDELAAFEQDWKGRSADEGFLPNLQTANSSSFNSGGLLAQGRYHHPGEESQRGRTKKIVRINIE